MYHTWFFQKRLAEALHDRLKSYQLLECFSQKKDELILGFVDKDTSVYLIADMNSDAGLIAVKDSFSRARKNSVNLFTEIIGDRVSEVTSFLHERSFIFQFESGYGLLFKMHASRSNLLLTKEDKVVSLFRNNLPADNEIVPSALHNPSNLDKPNIIRLLGKRNTYLIDNQKYDTIELINKINSNPIFLGLIDGIPALKLLEMPNPVLVTEDPIEATNKLVELHQRFQKFGKEKLSYSSQLSREVAQAENYISKSQAKLEELKQRRDPQELANLIMANLHLIKKGTANIELFDFYQNKTLEIKINPLLSAQANAENYYRKAKNRNIEFEKIEENIESKRQQIIQKKALLDQLEPIENWKELNALINSTKRQDLEQNTVLPYSVYVVHGFQILVGKNAKSNDHLTMKVATKNDLWLHAKDVSGSHVVIKHQAGKNFPQNVIEAAAQMAAFYSKRKTDSLCPVIYTPRKFVRKIKGAPAGQVVVDKEQFVMVVPTEIK